MLTRHGLSFINNKANLSGYLPLSGGTMTGAIIMKTGSGNGIKFGDGDSELYEYVDDIFRVKFGGIVNWQWSLNLFGGKEPGYGAIYPRTGSSTEPVLTFGGDTDTGIGRAAANQGSLIGGGVETARFTAYQFYTQIGRVVNTTTVNASTYDLLATDDLIHVTYTATGAVTSLTLPTAQVADGRIFYVKDAGGNANTNNITIDTEGAETIDGSATYVINGDHDYVKIYSDGSNWFTIG